MDKQVKIDMNILYIVHDNKKGGAALSFLEMISYIGKENNVFVLIPHKQGFVPQKLREMKVPYYNAHYFWWKIAQPSESLSVLGRVIIYKLLNVWNVIEAKRLRKKIQNMKIDLIHSNSGVIDFGALLSKETGIPHIWHLREYGEEDFNLKCVVSSERYKKEMNSYAKCYIAISKSIKEKFADIVDQNKIVQIYNGVSEKFLFEKKFSNNRNNIVKFLISGNYCKEKGQDDVIKAVIELKRQGVDGFKLYLAGNGNFKEARRLVSENCLENCVIFCGLVDNMLQLRKTVDVEIVASKCEAFGRVTIEAMRMSNPVIGTKAGGTPELVRDGFTGLLYEYGNSSQLAACMKRFIREKDLLAEMGQNAYREMKDHFTPRQNANAILALYKQVLN